eukprot:2668907-Alexandrium_andersonii.AAC.1
MAWRTASASASTHSSGTHAVGSGPLRARRPMEHDLAGADARPVGPHQRNRQVAEECLGVAAHAVVLDLLRPEDGPEPIA